MKTRSVALLAVLVFTGCSGEPDLENYGIYAETADGLIKLEPVAGYRPSFGNQMKNRVELDVDDGKSTLYIHQKNFEPSRFSAVQSSFTERDPYPLATVISPLKKADTYKIEVSGLRSPFYIIQAMDFSDGRSNVYMLPSKPLEAALLDELKRIGDAPLQVQQELADALTDLYPENKEAKKEYNKIVLKIAEARAAMELARRLQQDKEDFKRAQSTERYGPDSRTLEEYKSYIRKYPDGTHAQEAQQRIADLESKIAAENVRKEAQKKEDEAFLKEMEVLANQYLAAADAKDYALMMKLSAPKSHALIMSQNKRTPKELVGHIKIKELRKPSAAKGNHVITRTDNNIVRGVEFKKHDGVWMVSELRLY